MKQERSKEVLEILNGRETDFQSDPQTKEKIGYFTKLDKEKNSGIWHLYNNKIDISIDNA